jgi:hypothetical protein
MTSPGVRTWWGLLRGCGGGRPLAWSRQADLPGPPSLELSLEYDFVRRTRTNCQMPYSQTQSSGSTIRNFVKDDIFIVIVFSSWWNNHDEQIFTLIGPVAKKIQPIMCNRYLEEKPEAVFRVRNLSWLNNCDQVVQDFLPEIFCIHEQFLSWGFNQSETRYWHVWGERGEGWGALRESNVQ